MTDAVLPFTFEEIERQYRSVCSNPRNLIQGD
jgi:hypothetical protein